MLTFTNFSNKEEEKNSEFKLPGKINSIFLGYDGGRLSISINDIEILSNNCVGEDFCVEIDKI
jgi:hypothetical protein